MKFQKMTALLLAIAMFGTVVGCSGSENNNNTSQNTESTVSNETEQSETKNSSATKTDSGKTLVIYFSGANTKSADAVTGATQVQGKDGAVQHLAELIHNNVGGDIVKIVPSKDYALEYDKVADEAKAERDNNERPKFEDLGVNIADYDTVYVGYPMWWYTLPMIMYTFFDTYDFSGKTIIPFNTHLGSGDGGTYQTIKEFEPNATVKDGLAVSGSSVFDDSTAKTVKDWLNGLR